MSFVKALFGSVIGEDLSLEEGKIGFTKFDHQFKELEKRGIAKLFATYEEAEAFLFKTSKQLFMESYKSLNPPEGETAPPSSIDWANSQPIKVNGVPANHITQAITAPPVVDATNTDAANNAPESTPDTKVTTTTAKK